MLVDFEKSIINLWKERVDEDFIYRGMGLYDLQKGLDPKNDPFSEIRPKLFDLINVLEKAMSKGFNFTVHEDYSSMSFTLNNIIAWSRRDLKNPGLDFTSLHESACGYSKNYNGSQLKQNFKYMTDHLPEKADDPILKSEMKEKDWNIVSAINSWLVNGKGSNNRVIVWIKRSHPAFDVNRRCLPLGSLPVFKENIIREIEKKGLPVTIDSAISVLPKKSNEFYYRLTVKIPTTDIARIENG